MPEVDPERLRRWARAGVEDFAVPGLALAVIIEGDVLLAEGFGQRDLDSGAAVTADTVFAIGSATKAFTATALAILVRKGRLDWDAPIRAVLPDFEVADAWASASITTRDLLSHRTGMGRHELAWYGNYGVDADEMVHRLRHLPMARPLRQSWEYNNLGYITAGHLVETLTSLPYDRAVSELVLQPLGMCASSFDLPGGDAAADVAVAHVERESTLVPIPWRDVGLGAAAGGLNSTVKDMVRWLTANLLPGTTGLPLDGSDLAELHRATMLMPQVFPWPENRFLGYALGWMVESHRGLRTVHHGGNIDGLTAFVSFAPDLGSGLVGFANRNASWLPMALAARLYDELLGLPPLPWTERFSGHERAAAQGAATAAQRLARSRRVLPPSRQIEEYCGRFTHPGYGTLCVTAEGGALRLMLNDLSLACTHTVGDNWAAEYPTLHMTFELSFRSDFAGDIMEVTTNLDRTAERITFLRSPVPELSEPETLATYVGRYRLGPLTIEVVLDGAELALRRPAGPLLHLRPYTSGSFTLVEQPGVVVEFTVEDGAVTDVFVPAGGVFTRADDPAEPEGRGR
jgi:CubicO group peptidase (beta-lactamase class C family)